MIYLQKVIQTDLAFVLPKNVSDGLFSKKLPPNGFSGINEDII